MAILIDGYNLLYASGIVGRSRGPGNLERSRQALLNFLVHSLPAAELARTTIVFDAQRHPFGVPVESSYQGLKIVFSVGYDDADELLEELIRADSAPKRLTVVSSDLRVRRAARRRRASSIDSETWFTQIARRRNRPADTQTKPMLEPNQALSDEEIDYWLRAFDATPDEPGPGSEKDRTHRREETDTPPIENPFPPGYADDLLDEWERFEDESD